MERSLKGLTPSKNSFPLSYQGEGDTGGEVGKNYRPRPPRINPLNVV